MIDITHEEQRILEDAHGVKSWEWEDGQLVGRLGDKSNPWDDQGIILAWPDGSRQYDPPTDYPGICGPATFLAPEDDVRPSRFYAPAICGSPGVRN